MSEDLIKRSDAMEAVCEGCLSLWKTCQHHWDCPALTNLTKLLSADRPTGKWIKNYYGTVICSECKCPRRDTRVGHTRFCNACGARMKGADYE